MIAGRAAAGRGLAFTAHASRRSTERLPLSSAGRQRGVRVRRSYGFLQTRLGGIA
jgi:hypothetical protein